MPACCPCHSVPSTPLDGVAGQPGAWRCSECGYLTPILVDQARAALSEDGVPAAREGRMVIPLDVEMNPHPRLYLGLPLPDRGDSGHHDSPQTIGIDPGAMAVSLASALLIFTLVSLVAPTLVGSIAGVFVAVCLYLVRARRTHALPGDIVEIPAAKLRPGFYLLTTGDNQPWRSRWQIAYAVKVVSVWSEQPDTIAVVVDGSPSAERLRVDTLVHAIAPASPVN